MLEARIWQQILDISLETAGYIAQSILRRYKVLPDRHFAAWQPRSFAEYKEIFGMDLMLDKRMKVWMCEVNTDPGLGRWGGDETH